LQDRIKLGPPIRKMQALFKQMNSSYWDGVAKSLKETKPKNFWRSYNDAVNNLAFSRWLPVGKTALRVLKTDLFDESLGKGLYPLLRENAESVFGMDVSSVTAGRAKLNHPDINVVVADVRKIPFLDGSFDIVVSNSTLDHFDSIEDIVISLRELYRVLKKGGLLLITLDNPLNPVITIRNILPFWFLHSTRLIPYRVGATLSARHLRKLLEQLGFKVVEVKTIMHFPRILIRLVEAVSKKISEGTQQRLIEFLISFERLSSLPTGLLTGYFTGIKAIKQ
jgi:ubiquinone/menaquinone biosynthesis C-methylase UbiE